MPERTYRITATPEVGSDYMAIVQHIERWTGDRATAVRTVRSIRAFVRSLGTLPHRGLKRDDLRPGLRLIPFGRRTVIAFEIEEGIGTVRLLRIFYGGQDYETVMKESAPRR